jgi:hypothetical protein
MALYKVKGPDGKLHEFQGPDGMPENMVNLLAGDYFQPEAAPTPVTKPQAETGSFRPSCVAVVGCTLYWVTLRQP